MNLILKEKQEVKGGECIEGVNGEVVVIEEG